MSNRETHWRRTPFSVLNGTRRMWECLVLRTGSISWSHFVPLASGISLVTCICNKLEFSFSSRFFFPHFLVFFFFFFPLVSSLPQESEASQLGLAVWFCGAILPLELSLGLECKPPVQNLGHACIVYEDVNDTTCNGDIISTPYLATGIWQTENICLAKVSMRREDHNVEHIWEPAEEKLHLHWIRGLEHFRECPHCIFNSLSTISPSFLKTPILQPENNRNDQTKEEPFLGFFFFSLF